jgi:hypothetical protein
MISLSSLAALAGLTLVVDTALFSHEALGWDIVTLTVLMAQAWVLADRHPTSPWDFQQRVREQILYITVEDPTDLQERVARFGEEALELQQSLGMTREDAHSLVDYVFGRPVGEPAQEMGGVMNTLAGVASWAKLDMIECAERETERVWRPEVIAKIRRKRAGRYGRGPLPGIAA